jgi:putative FmdB family regulatory protein
MTYEYVCEACGHQWEAEQSIKDRPLQKCVSCGESKAKRLVSGGTGFLLKGGGWYADLYGSPSAASAKSGEDKPADKAAKTGSGASTEGAETKSPKVEAKPSGSDKSGSTSTAASPAPSTSSATPAAGNAKAS